MSVTSWRDLGGPARRIGDGISRAVDTVGDREQYERAAADLAAMPAGGILGALIRSLLENQHPDGLDGDDIQAILTRCYRDAAAWLPLDRIDAHVLIAVLSSALGIHEPGVTYEDVTAPADVADEEWTSTPVGAADTPSAAAASRKPPTTAEYAWHAPLLLADLLRAGGQRLNPYLDAAFAEIARAETMEMP